MIMRAWGDDTVRGGQTVFHGLRMWSQLVRVVLLVMVGLVLAVPAFNLWRTTTGDDWYGVGMVTLAETKLAFGYRPDSGQMVRLETGEEMLGGSTTSRSTARGAKRASGSWRPCTRALGSA